MLVARGAYHYFQHNARAEVTEFWQAFQDGTIKTQRHAPAFGSHLEIESREQAGRLTEFEVRWQNTNENAVTEARAHYYIKGEQLIVERWIMGEQANERHALPANGLLSPLLRIYTGKVIRQIGALGSGVAATVVVPWILNHHDHARLLTPLFDPRTVKSLGHEGELEKYNYLGGQYDDTAEFWVNPKNILTRYCWNEWDVQLKEYESF